MTMNIRERVVLDRLKESYESNGYQFFVEPTSQLLPKKMVGFRPDAIALRGNEKLIIEVKSRNDDDFARKLRIFSEFLSKYEPGWTLVVFPLDDAWSLGIDGNVTTTEDVRRIASEVSALHASGHHAAALLLGWGALEALARRLAAEHGDLQKIALGPGRAVDYLEQMGEISGSEAVELRRLVPFRNALSHGLYGEADAVGAEASGPLLRVLTGMVENPSPASSQ